MCSLCTVMVGVLPVRASVRSAAAIRQADTAAIAAGATSSAEASVGTSKGPSTTGGTGSAIPRSRASSPSTVEATGIEPATYGLQSRRSAN